MTTESLKPLEAVAHRIFDGEGGYTFTDGDPEPFNVKWAARYGRKHEPLVLLTDALEHMAPLQAEIERLRKDAERLDWLEQHDGKFYNLDRITSIVDGGFSHKLHAPWSLSLRAAIDRAMGKEP